MSEHSSSSSSGGIGFFGLLTVLFVGLKLTGYIDWSWVWVLAPIWIPIIATIGILVAFVVVAWLVAGVVACLGYLMSRSK
jgi:CHASE2 domain-containing sensor protein